MSEIVDKLKNAGYITQVVPSDELAESLDIHDSPTGTIQITENGEVDVTDYATAEVNVSGGSTPTGTIEITENGTVNVAAYEYADVDVSGGSPSGDYVAKNGLLDSIPTDYYDGILTNTPSAHRYDMGAFWVEQIYHVNLSSNQISFVKSTLDNDFNINDDAQTFINKMINELGEEGYYSWFQSLEEDNLVTYGQKYYPKDKNNAFILTKESIDTMCEYSILDFISDYENLPERDSDNYFSSLCTLLSNYNCPGSISTVSLPFIPDAPVQPKILLLKNITNDLNYSFPGYVGDNTWQPALQPGYIYNSTYEFVFDSEGTISGPVYGGYMYTSQNGMWNEPMNQQLYDITVKDDTSITGYKVLDTNDIAWRTKTHMYLSEIWEYPCIFYSSFPPDPSESHVYLAAIVFVNVIHGYTGDDWKTYAEDFGYYIAFIDYDLRGVNNGDDGVI
jgi:hypothetical protein